MLKLYQLNLAGLIAVIYIWILNATIIFSYFQFFHKFYGKLFASKVFDVLTTEFNEFLAKSERPVLVNNDI